MRLILALAVAAGVAALGAVILGEYTFSGPAVLGSGLVFGLFVAEAAVTVASGRSADRAQGQVVALAGGCAAIAGAAMVWSAWISTGHDLSFLEPEGWAAVVLAGVTAGIRAWWSRRAGDSSPREPAPAE